MIEDKQEFYEKFENYGIILRECSEKIRKDRKCCLRALKYNEYNWDYIDATLQMEENFRMSAIKTNIYVAKMFDFPTILKLMNNLLQENKDLKQKLEEKEATNNKL